MIFDLADHLEHLEGIEPKVGQQLAVERRLDRKAADPLQDVDDIPNERIRQRRRGCFRLRQHGVRCEFCRPDRAGDVSLDRRPAHSGYFRP